MVFRVLPIAFASLFAVGLAACQPQIGKSCTLSTDCSQVGDRLCDSSQPGGYCTIFDCNPDTCPNSVCVAFAATVDPACGLSLWSRFEASYCLAPCGNNSDCRPEYECVDLSNELDQEIRSAEVVDTDPLDGGSGYRVCMVAGNLVGGLVAYQPGNVPAICTASISDGGVPSNWVTYTEDAGGGETGAGGADGASPTDAGSSDQSGFQLDASPSGGSGGH